MINILGPAIHVNSFSTIVQHDSDDDKHHHSLFHNSNTNTDSNGCKMVEIVMVQSDDAIESGRLCFDELNPRTCHPESLVATPTTTTTTMTTPKYYYDPQQYCYELDENYMLSSDDGTGTPIFDDIPASDECCEAFWQVYHLCVWCATDRVVKGFCQERPPFATCSPPPPPKIHTFD